MTDNVEEKNISHETEQRPMTRQEAGRLGAAARWGKGSQPRRSRPQQPRMTRQEAGRMGAAARWGKRNPNAREHTPRNSSDPDYDRQFERPYPRDARNSGSRERDGGYEREREERRPWERNDWDNRWDPEYARSHYEENPEGLYYRNRRRGYDPEEEEGGRRSGRRLLREEVWRRR